MTDISLSPTESLGFKPGYGGAHIARTMMLAELTALLEAVHDPTASRADYSRAVVDENCLHKRSGKARALSLRHLVDLYALDPSIALFRTLRFLWDRDPSGRPLLALLCAYARDAVLRMSAPFILDLPLGVELTRVQMEEEIERIAPGRFSTATLKSVAQNLNGTWTAAGHLAGRQHKVRSQALATPASAAYALYLGSLRGERNLALFTTEYAKLLDCSQERVLELASEAARRGWIIMKQIGNVVEVQFPNLISSEEKEWLRESNQAPA